MTEIRVADRGGIRHLTIDRPHRRNAVTREGWAELRRQLEAFELSDQRVLVITGAGDDFCAGADLESSAFLGEGGVAGARDRMKLVGETAIALHRLTKPTIAAVRGVAAGAGMNLALGCDLVVAGESARFSQIFVRRGLTLDFGGSWLLPRIVGLQRAKELALTGRMVDAAEAVAIGLALEKVPDLDLSSRVEELAAALVDGAPVAQMLAKQAIDRGWEVAFEEAIAWEGQSQAICLGTEDFVEGVTSFLEKRPPRFGGK